MGTKTDVHVEVRANGGEHNEGRCSTKARMARAQSRVVAERAAARRAEEAFEKAHICEDGVEFFDLEEWERTVFDMAGVCPWPEDGEDPWGEEDGFDCEERGCSSDLAGHPWDCRAKTARNRGSLSREVLAIEARRLPASCSNVVATLSWNAIGRALLARRTSSLATKTELWCSSR